MDLNDVFGILPDSVIALILSKLPIKYAIKTSIISKRWRFLHTQMPELNFYPDHILDASRVPPTVSSIENIISNILLLHSGNLEAFHLHSIWLDEMNISSENVCKWVRYASRCNVKHLTLFYHNDLTDEFDYVMKETPPPALFSCTRLETLRLRYYDLTTFSRSFIGFPQLITCYLHDIELTDESLVSFISLCPLLQKLEIIGDSVLGNVEIFSSTLEHLYIATVKSLSVNCPKLKFLSGYIIENLYVNGVRFLELSHAIRDIKMHCDGTLRELIIHCSRKGNNLGVISANRFLHIMSNLQSLKRLVIYNANPFERESDMDIPLFSLLQRLPNLQALSILGIFVQELIRDHMHVCLPFRHLNLKKIRLEISKFDHNEAAVISCMLQTMPSLELLEIQLPDVYDKDDCLELFKEIMSVRRASILARIIVLEGDLE